jgi:hypothetical protein
MPALLSADNSRQGGLKCLAAAIKKISRISIITKSRLALEFCPTGIFVTFGSARLTPEGESPRSLRLAPGSMDHSCEQFQSRGPGVQFRRRAGNPIFQQSARGDWGDSDSTELAEVLPDIASRRFRRRREVGRTNPPHERSERGRFGSLTHHEARPSEWPGPFKRQHAAVRRRVQSDWVHF